jgi:flagellar biosynthetic protein FliQ
MPYQQFAMVGHETLQSVLFTVGPVLIAALAVGLVIGMVQAATSINEMTLSFLPKLVAVMLLILLIGAWDLQLLVDFARRIFERIPDVGL